MVMILDLRMKIKSCMWFQAKIVVLVAKKKRGEISWEVSFQCLSLSH